MWEKLSRPNSENLPIKHWLEKLNNEDLSIVAENLVPSLDFTKHRLETLRIYLQDSVLDELVSLDHIEKGKKFDYQTLILESKCKNPKMFESTKSIDSEKNPFKEISLPKLPIINLSSKLIQSVTELNKEFSDHDSVIQSLNSNFENTDSDLLNKGNIENSDNQITENLETSSDTGTETEETIENSDQSPKINENSNLENLFETSEKNKRKPLDDSTIDYYDFENSLLLDRIQCNNGERCQSEENINSISSIFTPNFSFIRRGAIRRKSRLEIYFRKV